LFAASIVTAGVLARPFPALRFGPPPQFEELSVGRRGPPHSVELRNSGLAPLLISDVRVAGDAVDFLAVPDHCTNTPLPPGRSCAVAVTFAPHREGRLHAELAVASEQGVLLPARLLLTGVASARRDFGVNPASIDFGDQAVGTLSQEHGTEVTSVARASLQINGARIVNNVTDDFVLANNGCTQPLPPAGKCFIAVTFQPHAAGERSAQLELADSSGEASHEITLVGRGTAGDLFLVPEQVTFPATPIGTLGETESVLVRSSGSSDVHLGTSNVGGEHSGDFLVSKNSCQSVTLSPNQTCQLDVQFRPTAPGPRTATLSLMDDAPDGPHLVHLKGAGANRLTPSAQLYAKTYSFGRQAINTAANPLPVLVISRGSAPLKIGKVELTGGPSRQFGLKTNCSGQTLGPKEHCEIDVFFRPASVGSFSARVSVPHDASDAPTYFDVDGVAFSQQVNWCCAGGRLSETDEQNCKLQGGRSYGDAVTARKMCVVSSAQPKPSKPEPPTGLEPGTSSPTNSPQVACDALLFHWSTAPGSDGYVLSVGRLTAGTDTSVPPQIVLANRVRTNEFRMRSPLEAGLYEWTVLSLVASGDKSPPAAFRYFRCTPRVSIPGRAKATSSTWLKGASGTSTSIR
jgi:hypothetical protein